MVKVQITALKYGSLDGKRYELGQIADLEEYEAERAIAGNVATPVPVSTPTPPPAPVKGKSVKE